MRSLLPVLLIATLALTGCGENPAPAASTPAAAPTVAATSPAAASPAAASPAPAPVEAHAAKNVVPGSYEDWCGEHAVPESQCTRCDASLIPAFRVTKDWCPEHALPESQCLKCNPKLTIVRPAKPAGQ